MRASLLNLENGVKVKIALVHEWLTNVAGAERVLLQLHEIFPDAPIYTAVYDPSKAKPFASLDIRTSILQNIPFMKSKRELLVPFAPFAFEQMDLTEYDVVISNTTIAAKGVLTKPHTVHISYCHTPPRYLWEPHLDPRASKGRLKWLRNRVSHNLRIWDRVAADRVDHYIANSQYVANRIAKYYQREADVIYPPVDIEKFKPTKPENIKDYYLFASRLVNYKKCDVVIDAFNKTGMPLKIIGRGPERDNLQKRAKSNIEFLGYLSDEELKKYYAEAKAFVFAAEEDFGIVPVEAMAAGRPVLAYGQGGASESILPGVTGEFFKVQTPESLVDALGTFRPESYDPDKIRMHAEKYSNERFKHQFSDAVEKLAKSINK